MNSLNFFPHPMRVRKGFRLGLTSCDLTSSSVQWVHAFNEFVRSMSWDRPVRILQVQTWWLHIIFFFLLIKTKNYSNYSPFDISHIPLNLYGGKYWYEAWPPELPDRKNHWSAFNVYKTASSSNIQLVSHWSYFLPEQKWDTRMP